MWDIPYTPLAVREKISPLIWGRTSPSYASTHTNAVVVMSSAM